MIAWIWGCEKESYSFSGEDSQLDEDNPRCYKLGLYLHQHTNDTVVWPHLEDWTQFGHHSIRIESCKRASQGGLWNGKARTGKGWEEELRSLGLLCPEQRRMSNTSEIYFKSSIEKEKCYFTGDANTWWKSGAQMSAAPSVQDKTATWLPHWNCLIQQPASTASRAQSSQTLIALILLPLWYPHFDLSFSPLYSALKKSSQV